MERARRRSRALYNAMGSSVLAQLARSKSDWDALERASQGRLGYKGQGPDRLEKRVGTPRFMPDEGVQKPTKATQKEIDTKIKYAVAVCNELEKSIREAYYAR